MSLLRLLLVLCTVVASGCSYGNTHDYGATTARLDAVGKGRVVVAVHDQRPYVVSGEKRPSFTGLSRTPVGLPLDVVTTSGDALAEDWTRSLSRALRLRGFEAVEVEAGPRETGAGVLRRMRDAGGKVGLLLTIRDWKSDTYIETGLDYDVTLEVADPAGEIVARSVVRGRDDLGGEAVNPPEYARRLVLEAYERKMERLLNDPEVVKALR